ncbi:hypothetical protein BUALT_Bualt04G0106200 [Buddleja alternifolia]|uniref:(+)-piperitol/(+)-sesamin synthase n=1 Tax=Buddleja alternifolia TaxID=168488 RepID=A0AAV6XVZ8_9LAMI|nr:hypothetical protein BUALT_Bualt04G0106200 [Buddleja alternifolia]
MIKSLHTKSINIELKLSNMETSNWLWPSFSLLLFVFLALKFLATPKRKLPPSPLFALPVIGHLHLFRQPLHRTFHGLSKKLGPIFSLRLGSRLVVVVSSPTVAEECFTKNDIVLANRPRFISGKYFGYNFTSLVDASYGEHWRNLRRLTTLEIFSSNRLNMFQSIRQDEIKLLLLKIYRKSQSESARVELRTVFSELSFNIMMRMIAGKRYFGDQDDENDEEGKQFRMIIYEVFNLSGSGNYLEEYEWLLRWIDYYKGSMKNMARVAERMDAFMQGLIDECRRSDGNNNNNTMIDHLLSLQQSQPEYYSDAIIKGIIMVMLFAGTDTSALTIEWAMSALLNHPDKLDKARAEIDNLVENDRLINESDLSKIPYLQHIIFETLRLFPVAPMLIPHESSCDCEIGGYDIPRDTILLVNAWAIHRDPMVWNDPTSFKPERFEVAEVALAKLLPFGMGRRSCPGTSLAQRVVGLALGSLIQCFEWRRIDGTLVDLREGEGLTMPKSVALEAKCKARDILYKVLFQAA